MKTKASSAHLLPVRALLAEYEDWLWERPLAGNWLWERTEVKIIWFSDMRRAGIRAIPISLFTPGSGLWKSSWWTAWTMTMGCEAWVWPIWSWRHWYLCLASGSAGTEGHVCSRPKVQDGLFCHPAKPFLKDTGEPLSVLGSCYLLFCE